MNNRIKDIQELNQIVIDFESMTKSEIIQHYKNIALDNARLKNENRRYVVSKKHVSEKENMRTRHNRSKRKKRSALLIFLEQKIAEARYTRKSLIDQSLFIFDSQYAVSTISTYLADSQNDRYYKNVFGRKVHKTNDILHFEDVIPKSKVQLAQELRQERINQFNMS